MKVIRKTDTEIKIVLDNAEARCIAETLIGISCPCWDCESGYVCDHDCLSEIERKICVEMANTILKNLH